MNSKQRRVSMRLKHMLLPLGKEVVISAPGWWKPAEKYTVFRHRSGNGRRGTGDPHRVDIRLQYHDGSHSVRDALIADVRLKNPLDRAPRPWWSEHQRSPA